MTQPNLDAFEIAKLYKYLRVADVSDAMDGIGYFDLGLMSPEIRPLWTGMKFWGPAFTIRCVPSNRPMWKLGSTEEIVKSHDIWFKETGHIDIAPMIKAGQVLVTDTGGSREVGFWGSGNSLWCQSVGIVGIVTDGYARDTAELTLQKTPVCAAARGRSIIPGRIQIAEVQTRIGCGGVQVQPGDIVGCDDDGIIAVPLAIAKEVAIHARAVLIADMRSRRKMYDKMGKPVDPTVDCEAVEAYYRSLE